MIRRFVVLALALALSLAAPVFADLNWFTAGPLTNPAANAVLADSGPRGGPASWQWQMICSASVNTRVIFQRRDAANTSSVIEQNFFVGANAPPTTFINVLPQDYLNQERLRVVVGAAVTGTVQCSLIL